MKSFALSFIAFIFTLPSFAQQQLTVEKIMRDPKWIGTSPANPFWSADSKTIYFSWNPVNALSDSLYKVVLPGTTPVKVEKRDRASLPAGENVTFNKNHTKIAYEKYGDLFIQDLTTKKTTQITNTLLQEFN